MATKPKATESLDLEVVQLTKGSIPFRILGTTPIILNRVSQKAQRELLFPSGRKTTADKAVNLKHDPIAEFRASPYRLPSSADSPTVLGVPAVSFKKALADAALDIPGAAKSQMGRLVYVEGDLVPLYGVPQLFMSITRSADIAKTPDVRTRAIVPNWACEITVTYAAPLVSPKAVVRLLAAAGLIRGVGDWRPQKGSGDYGQFELVDEHDERWQAIVAQGGAEAQRKALDKPTCYDLETEELLTWFMSEVERRDKIKDLQVLDPDDEPVLNGLAELVGV